MQASTKPIRLGNQWCSHLLEHQFASDCDRGIHVAGEDGWVGFHAKRPTRPFRCAAAVFGRCLR